MTSSPAADDPTRPDVELERVHRTWDALLAETLAGLDHLVAQTEEALRLTASAGRSCRCTGTDRRTNSVRWAWS